MFFMTYLIAKILHLNYFYQVIQASRMGGKCPYDFVKRNLSVIMNNDLASKYSWLGAKKKKKFNILKVAELILGKILTLIA